MESEDLSDLAISVPGWTHDALLIGLTGWIIDNIPGVMSAGHETCGEFSPVKVVLIDYDESADPAHCFTEIMNAFTATGFREAGPAAQWVAAAQGGQLMPERRGIVNVWAEPPIGTDYQAPEPVIGRSVNVEWKP
jgi:hypothetical protein